MIKTKKFLCGFVLFCIIGTYSIINASVNASELPPIDRHELVNRHNPNLKEANALSPFSVGNGAFAFTADVTGLQTFPEYYAKGTPLGTLSEWGWHTIPSATDYQLSNTYKYYDTYGRDVPYASQTNNPAGQWLRANPHRLHLGRIGFQFDDDINSIQKLKNINQTLNLWQGVLESSFQINGYTVDVSTWCHPNRDLIAIRVKTQEDIIKKIPIAFRFPYGSKNWGPTMADWNSPDKHETAILQESQNQIELKRTLDLDQYFIRIQFSENCTFTRQGPHNFLLKPEKGNTFEFICEFTPQQNNLPTTTVDDIKKVCEELWENFWMNGGAVDLSLSTDPRAKELERRIVLSQYLTAIQCASSMPPQESGLTHNSWYGKFHLEMHWWHAVHFALWNRTDMLEKSLPWYQSILDNAKETANVQGYQGARWPKMVGPDGREGPSGVGVFLIWQQPHPIYYAELCYRDHPNQQTLNKYQDIVFETAEFMASYAHWIEEEQRYVLGPPLIPAQECYPPSETFNPTFELAYWQWGLQCAQNWRERLGLEPKPEWQHVIENLSVLPSKNDLYVTTESTPDTFANTSTIRRDHPSLVGALGILPDSDMVNKETMRRTLRKIFEDWDWESTWGWDYPMLAMTAARVGEPELAIQSLLMDTPKNNYMPNGHCYQRENLPTYLPANGGLLTAIAMMAGGWDDGPEEHAPGFPTDGNWTVRYENLQKMP